MLTSFFLWLFQTSVAIILLAACYKFLLEKLTFFEWNRAYLLIGMLACLTIPLLPAPYFFMGSWSDVAIDYPTVFNLPIELNSTSSNVVHNNAVQGSFDWFTWLVRTLIAVYLGGVIYKTVGLISSLRKLFRLKRSSVQIDTVNGIPIYSQDKLPSFSFFNNIFLHENHAQLRKWEIQQILFHEQVSHCPEAQLRRDLL